MNRKAMIYSIVAFVLLFVIAGIFFAQNRRTGHDQFKVVRERVRTMDSFLRSIEQDSRRAAYIAGYRSLIAMEQQVTTTGAFFQDADTAFLELFRTGNLSNTSFEIMENSTFDLYVTKVKAEAAKKGMVLNLTIENTSLWQEDPWNLLINYTFGIVLTDSLRTATWTTEKNLTGRVPIQELRDPLFMKFTLARVQRVIMRGNVTQFVDDVNDKNDTTGLMTHFNNSYYTARGRGPDILMRFEGNLSDSPFGFESLVDTQEIALQDLPVNSTNSVVDYQYFGSGGADACNIQNTPDKIKLATEDLTIYEVEGKLDYDPC